MIDNCTRECLALVADTSGADRNVGTDLHIALAQFAWNQRNTILGSGIFDPEHFVGKQFAKPRMGFANAVNGERASRQAAFVDPLLDGDGPLPRSGDRALSHRRCSPL